MSGAERQSIRRIITKNLIDTIDEIRNVEESDIPSAQNIRATIAVREEFKEIGEQCIFSEELKIFYVQAGLGFSGIVWPQSPDIVFIASG